jgi:hypothetical protein
MLPLMTPNRRAYESTEGVELQTICKLLLDLLAVSGARAVY